MSSGPDQLLHAIGGAWLDGCETTVHTISRLLTGVSEAVFGTIAPPVLHWERSGSGPPVLLIMGLGLSAGAWWRTVPVLARSLEVITFDNRGVGRSQAVCHAYSTETMADDAVSVLDAAGVDRVHVYGISLGGMVAQQVALRHPERVRSLVLGATHAGGDNAHRPGHDVLDFLHRRPRMEPREAVWNSVQFNYGERCRINHPERIAADIAQRLAHPFPAQAYRAQIWAAALHDSSRRLHRIRVPTLVVHGSEDRMIPVENGRMIASRIPGARLIELSDTGHLYPTEAPHVDQQISDFMRAHS